MIHGPWGCFITPSAWLNLFVAQGNRGILYYELAWRAARANFVSLRCSLLSYLIAYIPAILDSDASDSLQVGTNFPWQRLISEGHL